MRKLFMISCAALIIFTCSSSECLAQKNEDYDIPLIKRALREQGLGVSFSFTEKLLNRLGDRVTIALLKTVDNQDLRNPEKLRQILRLVRQSFSSSHLIAVAEDKKPKVTLFFLTCLERETEDPRLRAEISELIKFINDRAADGSKSTPRAAT